MSKSLLWKDITIEKLTELEKLTNPDDIKRALDDCFIKYPSLDESKRSIISEMLFYNYSFAREQALSCEKVSAFLSIIKKLVNRDFFKGNRDLGTSYKDFKSFLFSHSISRPPYSVGIFVANDVQVIHDYILDSYYRNYSMYVYIFTPQVNLIINQRGKGMTDFISKWSPLSEALMLKEEVKQNI